MIKPPQTKLIKGKIVTEEKEIAQGCNDYFADIMKSFDIQENRYLLSENRHVKDPIDAIIKKYELHPSILIINGTVKGSTFSFCEVTRRN